VSEDSIRTSEDARQLTRRRREARADVEFDVPINDRTVVECPACETSQQVLFAGDGDGMPSFSSCWSWDCDAFHKFSWNGEDGSIATSNPPTQTGLQQFVGGGSAQP